MVFDFIKHDHLKAKAEWIDVIILGELSNPGKTTKKTKVKGVPTVES